MAETSPSEDTPSVKPDSFLQGWHVGLLVWLGWVPFLFLFVPGGAGVAVIGLALLFALLLYRAHSRQARPFAYARDAWEKEERARYATKRLEQRDGLLSLSPHEFEAAVARLFSKRGFSARQTPRSGDGGWDVEVTGDLGARYLIECKQYAPERTVGRPVLQKLHSALVTEGARGALCVTTASFSSPAVEFAADTGIDLIDGSALGKLMLEAYGTPHELTARGLCRVCGETVPFNPDDLEEVFKPCSEGHMVKHPFIIETYPGVRHARDELKKAGAWTVG